ncbi:MAG: hypothetical protein HRT47_09210 [Candidatus Caenarcaniphilales bacterium]|nr:hypothetical protein [Candidatus Caenarcaniphilales bacterium]
MDFEAWKVFFTLLLGCNGFIFGTFMTVEKVVNEKTKNSAVTWLTNNDLSDQYYKDWGSIFLATFDGLFTKKHLSLECFKRSAIISLTTFIFVFYLFENFKDETATYQLRDLVIMSPLFFTVNIFWNILIDYLSLLETRYILRWLIKNTSPLKVTSILLLDLLATGLIYFIGSVLFLLILIFGYANELVISIINYMTKSFDKDGLIIFYILGFFFITTFFTSIYLYLYLISSFTIKNLVKLNPILRFLKERLAIEKQPFISMGVILVLLISLIAFIIIFSIQPIVFIWNMLFT